MKFKKSALALAIAGVVSAPVALADVTMSGILELGIFGSDSEADANANDSDDGGLRVDNGDVILNIGFSHTLDNGATGYGHYRIDGDLSNNPLSTDNMHVGIKGGFGDIRVGEVPDALEFGQVANDALWDIGGEEEGISYTSPSFGGAVIGVNYSPTESTEGAPSPQTDDRVMAGIKFSVGNFGVGVGTGTDNTGETRLAAGATASFGAVSLAAAFKSAENFSAQGDRETIGLTAATNLGAVGAKLTYEAETGDHNEDDALIRLDLSYGLGGGTSVTSRITSFTDDSDGDGDLTEYRVLLVKTF